MNNSDLQKANEAKQTLNKFFEQFENDIYTRVVLEELIILLTSLPNRPSWEIPAKKIVS